MTRRTRGLRDRILQRYILFTTPTSSGLPNWRVVTWFPLVAALGVAVLVVLHLSGTSSGMHWPYLGTGEDPRLIFGTPKSIRGDEWYVQQAWVVSQSNTGFQDTNPTFPGGSDMTFLNELPSWHWSSLFRPHLWGYLLFGLDAGVAWHWWLPALGLVSGCYLFVVTMLPRRPITAALLAVGTLFTPLLQWFYTPSSVWPVAWTCLALAGIVWILVDKRLWVRVTWSALVGYTAVTMAMGLYVPFILPGIYVVVAFAVGYALRVRIWKEIGVRRFVGRIAPLLVAALLSIVVAGLWVLSRWSTFVAFQSTVYPGERLIATGTLTQGDPYLAGIGGAPWNLSLLYSVPSVVGANSSEGSSVILLCVFLLPGLLWIAVRSIGRGKRPDWLVLSCLTLLFVILAFLLIPGWDGLAHLLLLDRIEPTRLRIVFIPLLPLFAALVINHLDNKPGHDKSWKLGLLSAGFTACIMAALLYGIARNDPHVLGVGLGEERSPTFVALAMASWVLAVIAIVVATYLFFVRRFVALAAAMVLVTSAVMTVGVNPVYRGIYDLSETEIGQATMRIDNDRDGWWVGIGSIEPAAILVQTGVGSYSGVQNFPSEEMWNAIDPQAQYEDVWNRLAHISWKVGPGEPAVSLVQSDIVFVTFDACSRFAQENVDYLLSDDPSIDSECLAPIETIQQGPSRMTVFELVPPA